MQAFRTPNHVTKFSTGKPLLKVQMLLPENRFFAWKRAFMRFGNQSIRQMNLPI